MLVLAVIMLVWIAGGTAALVAAAIGVRHRAESAADLAALAGAAALQRGVPLPCSAAGTVARANGATLAACRIQGEMIDIVVTLAPRGPLARLPPARGVARAGPAASQVGSFSPN